MDVKRVITLNPGGMAAMAPNILRKRKISGHNFLLC
jgi:hypothetical protein